MLVHEYHTELARAIGDPMEYISGGGDRAAKLPDGVRYSAALRDSYLTSAMKAIQLSAMRQVAQLPFEARGKHLSDLFPNMITEAKVHTDGVGFDATVIADILFPLTLWLEDGVWSNSGTIIAITDPVGAIKRAYPQTVQAPDSTAGWTGSAFSGEYKRRVDLDDFGADSYVVYLAKAPNVASLAADAEVPFEESWHSNVLAIAVTHAKLDSQETDAMQAMTLIGGK